MNIYVGNMSYKMTEDDLRDLFAEFGEVTSAKIIEDRETGRPKGFAFVEMANNDDAVNAINSLNDKEIMGRNLKVNEARPRRESFRRNNRY
jgi:RNA recognition motif-containing protein